MFVLRCLMDSARVRKEKLYACFVDFKKAFDTVPRQQLWEHLYKVGVRGTFLAALISMYRNVLACVKTPAGGLTPTFECTLGVKQGCPLSPTLFGMYVDQLESLLCQKLDDLHAPVLDGSSIPCLLYADNVVLLSRTPCGLQLSLDVLCTFCKSQGLTVNPKKTQVVVFNDHRAPKSYMSTELFTYMGTPVDKVEQYVYLGITFHRKMLFTGAVEALAVAARKAMFCMFRRCTELGIVDIRLKCQLFDTLVSPILCYGCEIWGPQHLQDGWDILDKVHMLFIRKLLQVRQSTTQFMLYGETGRFPLCITWQKCVMKFYNRMVGFSETNSARLLVSAFKWAQQHTYDQRTWTAQLQQWASNIHHVPHGEGAVGGAGDHGGGWRSSAGGTDTLNHERSHFPTRGDTPLAGGVLHCATNSQNHGISVPNLQPEPEVEELDVGAMLEASKLAFIRKHTVDKYSRKIHTYVSMHGGDWGKLAAYLTWNLSRKNKVELTRFRVGAHALAVETGRWYRVPFESRICEYCALHDKCVVEDEQHFLFECPLYMDIRNQYQQCFVGTNSNLFSFFSSSRGDQLAPLIHSCFCQRSEFISNRSQQSCEPGLAP